MNDIEDIEDLWTEGQDEVRRLPHAEVQPKRFARRRRNKPTAVKRSKDEDDKGNGEQGLGEKCVLAGDEKKHVPGTQKVFIKTWGCSHNNRYNCPAALCTAFSLHAYLPYTRTL